jgi:hypothetical protein
MSRPSESSTLRKAWSAWGPALFILTAIIGIFSAYANLSFAVSDPRDYRFFPPFEAGVNANNNKHLGGEYFQMAKALVAGEGFAHPFDRPTGPSAWQPPVLPCILAGILWVCGGSHAGTTIVVVILQSCILVATGILVMALAHSKAGRVGANAAALVYLIAVTSHFQLCFQFTHDCWLVLLGIDVIVLGLCILRPMSDWKSAAGWGLFGGLCTLTSPILGLTWAMCTVGVAICERALSRFGVALFVAALALAPWTIRNYLIFGRLIPVKANLAYELYQSHCLQQEGLLRGSTFSFHPFRAHRQERKEYERLGESAYLELKWRQFSESVQADPADYVRRLGERFVGATLWYVPFWENEYGRPYVLVASRLVHALPFLALLLLLVTSFRSPLEREQWVVIGAYLVFLLPYIAISYYDRYALPLLGIKSVLVCWALDRLLLFLSPVTVAPESAQPAASGSPDPSSAIGTFGRNPFRPGSPASNLRPNLQILLVRRRQKKASRVI